MDNIKLNKEGLEILKSVENNEWVSIKDIKKKIKQLQYYLKHQNKINNKQL